MSLIEVLVVLAIIVILFVVGGVALFMMKRTVKMAIRLAIACVLLFVFLVFSGVGIYLWANWSSSNNQPTKSKPTRTR